MRSIVAKITATRLGSALKVGALAVPLAIGLAGCEAIQDFKPFDKPAPPLPGERRAVFPGGVPVQNQAIPQPYGTPGAVTPAPVEEAPAEPPKRRRRG